MQIPFKELGDRYAFLDPAGGRQQVKRLRARQAIIVVAADSWNRIYCLYAWADRLGTAALITKLFEVHEQFHLRQFGVEANAMQALFADVLIDRARELKKRVPFVPITQPTKIDKDFRIRTVLQPVIANGRLFIQPHQHELRAEITTFPMNPLKDLVDALASAINLVPHRTLAQQTDSTTEALASYLRDQGVAPHLIAQRLADVQAGRAHRPPEPAPTRQLDSD